MKKISLLLFFILCLSISLHAQLRNSDVYEVTEMQNSHVRNEIRIPDFDGYTTLKCDFHIHTIFSDGKVWPDIRVMEAWQEGLDAIAITDHIEYRPHKDIVKGDLNESYKIAKKAGDAIGFIVIQGTEITRSKPLGHLNALFINDAMPMDVKDPLDAIDEAIRQSAFIMWNHPGWPDDKSTLYPVHEELIKTGKIHGVEVFNHLEYYPVSFNWCKDYNLSFLANTDIHDLVNITYDVKQNLRPMTLVLAKERSEESIKEALFAQRSIAFFDGQLVGKPQHLKGLLKASLKVRVINEKQAEITNISDITYRATAGGSLYIFPAQKTILISTPQPETVFTVDNCFTGEDEKLTISASDFIVL